MIETLGILDKRIRGRRSETALRPVLGRIFEGPRFPGYVLAFPQGSFTRKVTMPGQPVVT